MSKLRTPFVASIVLVATLSGCGILDKLKGKKAEPEDAAVDAGAVVEAPDAAAVVDAAVATPSASVTASPPIIGACKPNDLADCTNKCEVLKNQGSCVNLGIMFANGTGVPRDLGKAATLFQNACNGSVGAGCEHFGLALLTGQGIQTDQNRAADIFKKGCDLRNAESCNRLALMASRGQGGPKDSVKASQFFEKSCNLGDAFGCGNFANHLATGDGVPQDIAKAATLRKQACDKGDNQACRALQASGLDAGASPTTAGNVPDGGVCDCACQRKTFLLECNRTRKLQDVPCDKQANLKPELAKCKGK